jgi:hypothetical protein
MFLGQSFVLSLLMPWSNLFGNQQFMTLR